MPPCLLRIEGCCPGYDRPAYRTWWPASPASESAEACIERLRSWQAKCGSAAAVHRMTDTRPTILTSDHGRALRASAACSAPPTPEELNGKVTSPCLRVVGRGAAQRSGLTKPVCMLKAPQNGSCTRKWEGTGTLGTFGMPRGARYLPAHNEEPLNDELGRDHAWLPVTHTKTAQDPDQVGVWFHYMRGCSDSTWNAGRTLLTRNKCDNAVQLERRAFNVSRRAALLRIAHKLVFDRNASFRNPRASAPLLIPRKADGREDVHELASALDRCSEGAFGQGLDSKRCRARDPFECARETDPAIGLAALNVLDMVSAALLDRELKDTSGALDTLQNHNRCDGSRTPRAIMGHNFCAGFVEVWDVREFSGSGERGQLGNLHGKVCELAASWAQCVACHDSETEEACAYKCSMPPTRYVDLPRDMIAYNIAGDGSWLGMPAREFPELQHVKQSVQKRQELARRLARFGPGGMTAFFSSWRQVLNSVPSISHSGRSGEPVLVCSVKNVTEEESQRCIELPKDVGEALLEPA